MTFVMWVWDAYDKYDQPAPDYDPPPTNYFVVWVILLVVISLYGFMIGQAYLWLCRRRQRPGLRVFLVANLVCGSIIGLALNYWGASQPIADSGNTDTLVDVAFVFLMTGGGAVLWSLIFFAIRQPDRDAKDVSPPAS